jgi:hypothetical protein
MAIRITNSSRSIIPNTSPFHWTTWNSQFRCREMLLIIFGNVQMYVTCLNLWVSPSTGILNNWKYHVLETGSIFALRWRNSSLALSKGPNRVGVFLPSPHGGSRPSLWNVVFSIYLEYWTMNKDHRPSNTPFIHLGQEPLDDSWIYDL